MEQTAIHINASKELVRRMKDPSDPNLIYLETTLPFSEANKLVHGNANVRRPKPSSRPFRKMVETVAISPGTFHHENRGIIFFCKSFHLDNDHLQVNLASIKDAGDIADSATSADALRSGIADGGHTFAVISSTMEHIEEYREQEGWVEPYVRVKFIPQAANVNIERIVEGLNTSTQVKDYTIDDYRSEFDPLKDILTEKGFDTSLISWRENDPGEWDIRALLQRLACFLPDKPNVGAQMYKSRQRALRLYIDDKEQFTRLKNIMLDLLFLPEFVEAQFSSRDNIKSRTRFGAMRVVRTLANDHEYPGLGLTTKHRLDLSATLPVAGAFRECISFDDDGTAKWDTDYQEVFALAAEDLYRALADSLATVTTGSVSAIGSSNAYWASCSNAVLRAKSKILSKRMGAAA